ncbi:MAG TPA: helix-turn-helix domain-containing protein [Solirubrobacteraceae bacterium]
MSGAEASVKQASRKRVPAAQRREELIEAAVHEFARGGLHGTSVERIAKRVGVAQPYVFALFQSKRELFIAAVERGFERIADIFGKAAADYEAGNGPEGAEDVLMAIGLVYKQALRTDRDYLMLQHQSYAACDDELVRTHVRKRYALLVELARELSGADDERLDQFFSRGMALNVAAAMDVMGLSPAEPWIAKIVSRAEQDASQ